MFTTKRFNLILTLTDFVNEAKKDPEKALVINGVSVFFGPVSGSIYEYVMNKIWKPLTDVMNNKEFMRTVMGTNWKTGTMPGTTTGYAASINPKVIGVNLTKYIDKPVTILDQLIDSKITKIADINIGKTSVSGKVVYFGNKVAELIDKGFDKVGGIVNSGFTTASAAINAVFSTAGNIINTAFTAGANVAAILPGGSIASSTLTTLGSITSSLMNTIGYTASSVINVAGSIIGGAINLAGSAVGGLFSLGSSAIGAIASSSIWGGIASFFTTAFSFVCPFFFCPLTLDLDGDGIKTISFEDSKLSFDMDGDGFKERTGWISGKDGSLVIDKNNNGKIDDINELFGTNDPNGNGFDKLKELDTNKDGKINALDKDFSKLRVWQDVNENGITDAGELKTLASYDIKDINLDYKDVHVENNGNYITQISSFTKSNGKQYLVADVYYQLNQSYSTYNGDYNVSMDVLNLPWIRGYGVVKDLPLAMTENEALKNLVSSMANETNAQNLYNKIDNLLFNWAGVQNVSSTTLKAGVDGKIAAFIEKFLGVTLKNDTNAKSSILETYNDIKNKVYTIFVSQTDLGKYLNINYNFIDDKFEYDEKSIIQGILANYKDAQRTFATQIVSKVLNLNVNYGSLNNDSINGSQYQDIIFGDTGNDTINAGDGDDFIIGGSGNDSLSGGLGNDTYIFNRGDGQDTINDFELSGTPGYGADLDTLRFGADITKEDLVVTRDNKDIVITIKNTKDQIVLKNQLQSSYTNRGIAYFEFIDGTKLTNDQIGNMIVINGTSGNDSLIGTKYNDLLIGGAGNDTINGGDTDYVYGNDTIIGGTGNDSLSGGFGNDTYVFNKGDGQDTINDIDLNETTGYGADLDILRFGAGITKEDLIISKDNKDVVISIKNTTDKIILKNQLAESFTNKGITYFEFADGTKLTSSEIKNLIPILGTSGNDTINGDSANNIIQSGDGDDIIDGKGGIDTMIGGKGNDTYYVENTKDVITENSNEGTDLVNSSVSYTLSNNVEDLTLSGTSSINGTGNALNNKLTGNSGNNILTGGKGNDTLAGGNGNDTYVFNKGDNIDNITDTQGSDVIKFSNTVSKSKIAIFKDSTGKLIIDYGDTSNKDRVTINNWSNTTNQIEKIQAGDNTYLSNTNINKIIQDMTTYASTKGIFITSIDSVKSNTALLNIISTAWHN